MISTELITLGFSYLAIVVFVIALILRYFSEEIISWVKPKLCKHRFAIQDMRRTGEEESDERITWPCWKCGKEFKAHCGLDIYRNGVADNNKPKGTMT